MWRSIVLIPLMYVLISTITHPVNSIAEAIRKPVWAGRFYPADAADLKDLITTLERSADEDLPALPEKAILRALIMPHAGYIYSGLTAAHCSRVLGTTDNRHIRKVIILAPDHHLLNEDTLIVASSDLSHYLSYEAAMALDRDTIRKILALDIQGLEQGRNRACGMIPILTLMRLSRIKGWTPVLLNYTNSGDTAGGKDRVVGYAGIAYYQSKEVNDDNTQIE